MKRRERLALYQSIVAAGPVPIVEVRLLEGPWGPCDVTPAEYFQLCRDYGGHSTTRRNAVSALGNLHRATGQGGRTRWTLQQVREQLKGAYHWDMNIGLFHGVEPVTTWAHTRVERMETHRETMKRALETCLSL